MEEIYEKIIKKSPELKYELMTKLYIMRAQKVLDLFMEKFDENSTRDTVLLATFAQIIAGYYSQRNQLPTEIIDGKKVVRMIALDAIKILTNELKRAIKDLEENVM